MPVLTGGTAPTDPNSLKLQDTADALLYLGPRDTLTAVNMSRADLEGTPYGREIAQRLEILFGQSPNIFPGATETPQFPPGSGGAASSFAASTKKYSRSFATQATLTSSQSPELHMAARATCSRKWKTWPNEPEVRLWEMAGSRRFTLGLPFHAALSIAATAIE